jgi:hypothetical protein
MVAMRVDGPVWLRAHFDEEATANHRALWPASLIQALGAGLVAFFSVAWIVENWNVFCSVLSGPLQANLTWVLERVPLLPSLLLLGMIFVSLLATLVLYPILSED